MKIAVATDLSAESGLALKRAAEFARAHGGTVAVMYIVEPEFWEVGSSDGLIQGMQGSPVSNPPRLLDDPGIRQRLEDRVREFCEKYIDIDVEIALLEGDPFREIRRFTASMDLLGLGAPAETLTRFSVGSVAERLCHKPLTNTLIAQDFGDPKIWVVATDFSENSKRLLEEAQRAAKKLGATLKVVHVIPSPVPMSSDLSAASVIAAESLTMSALKEWSETQMATLAEQFPDLQTYLVGGYPVLALDHFVREQNAGLLWVASHSRGKLEDVLLGSVAFGLVKRMPTSLMLVPDHAST